MSVAPLHHPVIFIMNGANWKLIKEQASFPVSFKQLALTIVIAAIEVFFFEILLPN